MLETLSRLFVRALLRHKKSYERTFPRVFGTPRWKQVWVFTYEEILVNLSRTSVETIRTQPSSLVPQPSVDPLMMQIDLPLTVDRHLCNAPIRRCQRERRIFIEGIDGKKFLKNFLDSGGKNDYDMCSWWKWAGLGLTSLKEDLPVKRSLKVTFKGGYTPRELTWFYDHQDFAVISLPTQGKKPQRHDFHTGSFECP